MGGVTFCFESQHLLEPRADFRVALVHKSLVEPEALRVDLWDDISQCGNHRLALKVVTGLNTVMPSEAILIGQPPAAYRIKSFASAVLPDDFFHNPCAPSSRGKRKLMLENGVVVLGHRFRSHQFIRTS